MNRKGFTLIELLAVIVVLGIILVITAPSISEAYKNSKLKSEEIFIDQLSGIIDSYVKLNSNEFEFSKVYGTFKKTYYIASAGEEQKYDTEVYEGKISEHTGNRRATFNDIISENLMSEEDYINAGNKEMSCKKEAEIEVYRDSDYVYCYKIKKESLGCLTENYKKSFTGDYVIDTCIWEEVK